VAPAHEIVWTIVVAGGSGRRFGGPKQYESLGTRRVLDWAVAAARDASDAVVLVVPAEDAEREGGVAGGATRAESVRAGLAAVPAEATIICVHDGARPFAGADVFARVIGAVAAGADAAIPGTTVVDTIKQVDAEGTVTSTPARDGLRAVQTPQAFRAAMLRAAHEAGGPLSVTATDDAALVEQAGAMVMVVEGDARNRKITDPADLRWAREQVAPVEMAAMAGTMGAMSAVSATRVGQGFDIHRFSDDPARPLVLGGVVFEGHPGLHGHSDADAVAHAVTDALLGAAGLGDIGEHFPDTDPQWKGADSIGLLRHAAALVRDAGWTIGNVDCSVVCEAPKLAPHKAAMQERLSAATGAPVTVKGRRAEGLGALGRQEGIAVWAVAVITRSGTTQREGTGGS
jgi:2-C-methyl-D-erythritol 4-phosphate cytidylyltransferase/2-C-methyl-D-erythritol 2,4-cyclodiphosphate synthase